MTLENTVRRSKLPMRKVSLFSLENPQTRNYASSGVRIPTNFYHAKGALSRGTLVRDRTYYIDQQQ